MNYKDIVIGIHEKIEVFYFYDEETRETLKYVVELEKGGLKGFYTQTDCGGPCERCSLRKLCDENKFKFYCLGDPDTEEIIAHRANEKLCNHISGVPIKILDISKIKNLDIPVESVGIYESTKSISFDEIISCFCKKFCPMFENNLSCSSTNMCPFKEQFKDNLFPFCLPITNTKNDK